MSPVWRYVLLYRITFFLLFGSSSFGCSMALSTSRGCVPFGTAPPPVTYTGSLGVPLSVPTSEMAFSTSKP